MSRVLALLKKELRDLVRQRVVLLTLLLVPTLLTAVALASVLPLGAVSGEVGPEDLAALGRTVDCAGLEPDRCLQLSMSGIHRLLYLVIPTTLPTVIAAYSVVGEKTERTLEALLATPIRTAELLAGKALAAVLPTLAATWLAAGAHAAGLASALGADVLWRVYTPTWLVALVVTVPALATASVLLSMMVSTRSTDPRSAQQVGGLVVVPVVAMLIAQSLGVGVLTAPVLATMTLVVIVLDALLGWACLQLFERETILTRWTGL